MEQLCPDFELAELQNFDPNIFISYKSGEDEIKSLDAFIITLGLIFNDLKGLQWWNEQLGKGTPKKPEDVNAYNGQWNGMKIQISRLALGLFAELLKTINRNEKILRHPMFIRTLKELNSTALESWKDLVTAAKNENSQILKDKKLFSLIQEVRNNGVFHYENTEEVHKGFIAHFGQKLKVENPKLAEYCYYSVGKTMQETRFYFSDAAIDGYSRLKGENFIKTYGETNIYEFTTQSLLKINFSLRFIVEKYIRIRKTS